MAKQRIVNTKFWSDNYIASLDPLEKLLFLYCITNSYTNLSGVYEITLKQIALDTGIDQENLEKVLLPRLAKNKKIFYINGWIFVKNFRKHQKSSGNIQAGIKRAINEIPVEIRKKLAKIDKEFKEFLESEDSETMSEGGQRGVRGYTDEEPEPEPKPKPKPKPKPEPEPEPELELEPYRVCGDKSPTPQQEAKSFFENIEKQNLVLQALVKKYGNENMLAAEIKNFISYWTERNKSGKKQRWELEKTFEINRRLTNWLNNMNKFKGQKNNKPSGVLVI